MENSFSLPSLSKCSLWLLSALRYWGRFMIKLSSAWATIVTTGASWPCDTSRSFTYSSFDAFLVVYTEFRVKLCDRKIFLRVIVKIFLHLSLQESKQHFLLHVYCDLPSFNTAVKIHQTQTTWVTCFPLSAQRPSESPDAVAWACLSLFFSLYHTFVCTKNWLAFPWLRHTLLSFDIDRGKWLHAHSSVPFIL